MLFNLFAYNIDHFGVDMLVCIFQRYFPGHSSFFVGCWGYSKLVGIFNGHVVVESIVWQAARFYLRQLRFVAIQKLYEK